MAVRHHFTFGPEVTSLPGAIEAIARLGYRAVRARTPPVERVLVCHDTWDLSLARGGRCLVQDLTAGTWLLTGGSKEATEPVVPGRDRPVGRLARRVERMARRAPYIRHITANVRETGYRLHHIGGGTVSVRVRLTTFTSAHLPGTTRSRVTLDLPAGKSSVATVYLGLVLGRGELVLPVEQETLELGLATLGLRLPGAPQRSPARSDPLGGAAARILRSLGTRMEASTTGAIRDLDPEYVHDLRVATRVLRHALGFLRDLLPVSTDALREELRWLAAELGAVRDHDVLLDLLARAGHGADAVTEPLGRGRTAVVVALGDSLASPRYTSILARARDLADALAHLDTPASHEPVRRAAARVIRRTLRPVSRLAALDPGLLSSEALHEARGLVRRLRYACDLFRPVFGRGMREALAEVVSFQDCLGGHHDADVAIARLVALATAMDPTAAQSLGTLIDNHRVLLADSRERIALLWSNLPTLCRLVRRAAGPRPGNPRRDWAPSRIA